MDSVALNLRSDLMMLGGREGPVKSRIGKLARRLGWSYSRAFEHWYGRAKMTAVEYEQIRAAVRTKQDTALREVLDVAGQMQALAARLESVDAEFFSTDILALRALAARSGGRHAGDSD